MPEKKITYTDNDRAIVDALRNAPEGLTIAEVNEATGLNIQPGSFTSAKNKGLITVAPEKRVVMGIAKRPTTVYHFVTADVLSGPKGAYNYTDKEQALLSAASQFEDSFMLFELADAMGLEKLSSGSINGLVKKGNISKEDEKVIREVPKANSVNVYLFCHDIPE